MFITFDDDDRRRVSIVVVSAVVVHVAAAVVLDRFFAVTVVLFGFFVFLRHHDGQPLLCALFLHLVDLRFQILDLGADRFLQCQDSLQLAAEAFPYLLHPCGLAQVVDCRAALVLDPDNLSDGSRYLVLLDAPVGLEHALAYGARQDHLVRGAAWRSAILIIIQRDRAGAVVLPRYSVEGVANRGGGARRKSARTSSVHRSCVRIRSTGDRWSQRRQGTMENESK
mmetsp:Transcript_15750/g.43507  ORF Transcript_15750/g.43507 Transcript_15750/m.43507 type:complete len:225 (+) Transcript_15750:536-1210(+)